MLTILLALGLLGPVTPGEEPSTISTPTQRIIVLSRANGFAQATHAIDPYDVLNYLVDLSSLLEADEGFDSVDIAILPASAVQGFTIPESGPYQSTEVDDRHILIWPQIGEGNQGSAAWAGKGTTCGFEVSATTTSTPPRRWQRTVLIRVAQR